MNVWTIKLQNATGQSVTVTVRATGEARAVRAAADLANDQCLDATDTLWRPITIERI